MSHSASKISAVLLVFALALLLFSSEATAARGGDIGTRAMETNPQRLFPINSQIDNYYQYNQYYPNTPQLNYPKQKQQNSINCIQTAPDGSCEIEVLGN